jgi:hypothetical protein
MHQTKLPRLLAGTGRARLYESEEMVPFFVRCQSTSHDVEVSPLSHLVGSNIAESSNCKPEPCFSFISGYLYVQSGRLKQCSMMEHDMLRTFEDACFRICIPATEFKIMFRLHQPELQNNVSLVIFRDRSDGTLDRTRTTSQEFQLKHCGHHRSFSIDRC